MSDTAMDKVRHLTLDGLTVNWRLARRLPPGVACRYHALPVAEDRGHITVAMADPEDPAAREAVLTALGAPSCVVKGNPVAIDALLAEIWPNALQRSPRLLVCAHASSMADQVINFARALGDLLEGHVSYFSLLEGDDFKCDALAQAVEQGQYDLIVWGGAKGSLGRRLLSGPAHLKAVQRINCSFLMARQSRWPLKRLLLIVRGAEIDSVAADWVVHLARPSGATVTALAVVPPVPAMYSRQARMQQGLETLLKTETDLGCQMRRMARWLVDWEIESTLRLRQGAPDQQIQCEIAGGNYDLIIVAAKPRDWWQRWLPGGVVAPLLRWADQPVLIARPSLFGGALCLDKR